jgi:DNA-binding transcriptional ArsR family regulator
MQNFVSDVSDRDLDQLASLFQLLSDRTRLRVLMLLAEGERNVTSLCDSLNLPQPTVSHHLGLLRVRNIISNRRVGKQVFYSLNGIVNAAGNEELQIGLEHVTVRIGPKSHAVQIVA